MFWIILVISIILGVFARYAIYHPKGIVNIIFDVSRHAINYFIALGIGYYFIVRWDKIKVAGLITTDLILGLIFIFAVFGWLPYLCRDITNSIDRVVKKYFPSK